MSFAQGSKSQIAFLNESAYGVPNTGNFNGLTFESETLGGSIGSIISSEIRSDRTVPAVRGGNISANGNLVGDFALARFAVLFAHLLASGAGGYTDSSATVTAVATPTISTNIRGDIVSNGGNLYMCVIGGTSSATISADLAAGGTTQNVIITSGTAGYVYLAASSSTYYRHLLNAGPNFPATGLTFEKGVLGGTTAAYFQFYGGRVNSLALSVPQEGIPKATWDLVFANASTENVNSIAGTPTYPTDDPVTGFETTVTIGGTEAVDVQTASMNITNNIDMQAFRVGSRYRVVANPQRREITGQLKLYFDTVTQYNNFATEAIFSMEYSFAHNGGFLSLTLPNCKFLGDPVPHVNGAGNVMVDYTWHAFKPGGASYDVELILKDTTASYNTAI